MFDVDSDDGDSSPTRGRSHGAICVVFLMSRVAQADNMAAARAPDAFQALPAISDNPGVSLLTDVPDCSERLDSPTVARSSHIRLVLSSLNTTLTHLQGQVLRLLPSCPASTRACSGLW